MTAPLLRLTGIELTFGGTPLLTGASLSVVSGDRISLVGRNGSGKSTLLKIAAGLIEPDAGEVFSHPNARVAYLPQEVDFGRHTTPLSYVEAGLGPLQDTHQARRMLQDLSIDPDASTDRLSGGEARRVALARVLAAEPDVMLLDEPTNHLDLPAIEWLEQTLSASQSALVLISHDRRMLESLTRSTVWLDRGECRQLDRGFKHFEAWRDKVLEEETLQRHKLDRKIERELEWMYGGGVTARRKRNMRRVGELHALRQQRRDAIAQTGQVRMQVSEAQASGKIVIEAAGVSKSFGERPIVTDLTLRIARGDRLGLIGANGAGKTTIINLLTGQLQPDAGTVKIGSNVELVTLDQRRAALDPADRVADVLTGGRSDWVEVNGQRKHVARYLSDFLFQPEQARSHVKVLSGGERARLLLARALAKPSNLLVLDEPTNDLDIDTLDLLQELLADYPGTLLLVSHDRDFLDRVATSVLVAEGDGRWIEYAGGYSDMVAQRGRGVDARQDSEKGAVKSPAGETLPRTGAGTPAAGPAPAVAGRRKLTFKETHALKTLPETMARLEAEIAQLAGKVGDTALYAKDPAAFNAATVRLGVAQAELSAAEEQWLELELLRQELES